MAESTLPRQCALAVCLPRSLDAFERDLAAGSVRDFASSFARRYPEHGPAQVWAGALKHTMDHVDRILTQVERRGVYVVRDASLQDLEPLFRRFSVVTLATHWRPPWVTEGQVRDFTAIIDRLTDRRHKEWSDSIEFCAGATSPADLAAALNKMMESTNLGPSTCPPEWHEAERISYRLYANRTALDAALAPALADAPPLEFWDGMKSVAQMLDCVPQDFDGCLDITICNSMVAVDEIKRTRSFTCIGNEGVTELGLRMDLYAETISVLSEAPFSYVDAAREIRIALIHLLDS